MTKLDKAIWAYKSSTPMLDSALLSIKRGDVFYSDEQVRLLPWGKVKNWKGIQILEYGFSASVIVILKNDSGELTFSRKIIISDLNLKSLIKTDENWIGYEVIDDQNDPCIILKHQNIAGNVQIGPQININYSDFQRFKVAGSLDVDA